MRHRLAGVVLALGMSLWRLPAGAEAEVICTGDCDYDGTARIEELITGVGIALGSAAPATCAGFDPSADGTVTVDELLGGVRNALDGCPRARYLPETCDPALLPAGQAPAAMSCGSLIVPENRGRQNGRTIRLAVAVLRATGPAPAPDPLILLNGGPGGWSLDEVEAAAVWGGACCPDSPPSSPPPCSRRALSSSSISAAPAVRGRR